MDLTLIYQLDGRPIREDGTLEEFLAADENGCCRLVTILEKLVDHEEAFCLTPSSEIFPHDYSVPAGISLD